MKEESLTVCKIEDISNYRLIAETLSTGGQPTEAQLRALREQGTEVVINVAPYDARYSIEDEPGLVCSLGMEYHYFPITFGSPKLGDYLHVKALLEANDRRKVFLHCAANYRVSVLAGNYAVAKFDWTLQARDSFIRGIWKIEDFPAWVRLNDEISEAIRR